MSQLLEIHKFINAAVEASIYVNPTDHGLTPSEVFEVGRGAGFLDGELRDAVNNMLQFGGLGTNDGRLRLVSDPSFQLADFILELDPEFRNVKAFQFVAMRFRELARQFGMSEAKANRASLVAQGIEAGFSQNEIEVAVEMSLLVGRLNEENGVLAVPPQALNYALPEQQVAGRAGRPLKVQRPEMSRAMPLVKDVVSRRTDGRPSAREPLDAFQAELPKLGAGQFMAWWIQTVSEFRTTDPLTMPTCACVLAAGLAEAALCFVVRPARAATGAFDRLTLDEPKTWRFEQLLAGARHGDDPIIDDALLARGRSLNVIRQRIHAGRLLAGDFGAQIDTRPEEAREARITAESIVRRILDWRARHPI